MNPARPPRRDPGQAAAPRWIASLEGLRGIAALAVVVDHTVLSLWRPAGILFGLMVMLGEAGVGAFFLISGYVIFLVLQRQRAGTFAILRVFRLYPTAAVVIPLMFVMLLVTGRITTDGASLANLGASLTLVGGLGIQVQDLIAPITWTLTVEIAFYAVAVAVVLAAGRRDADPATRASRQCRATCLVLLAIVVANLSILNVDTPLTYMLSLCCALVPMILLGSLIFLLREMGLSRLWFGIAVVLVIAAFGTTPATWLLDWAHVTPGYILAIVVFLLAVAWPEGRLLCSRLLQQLGSIAYPLYLGHEAIIVLCTAAVFTYGLAPSPVALAGIPVMLATAWLVHRHVEAPAYAWGRRRFGSGPPVQTAVEPLTQPRL